MIDIISVDDHEMISFGLERVFSETSDIRVCHFCKTKAELQAFISKSADKSEILDAIRAVARGETYIQKNLESPSAPLKTMSPASSINSM